jgi:hypothetical protein
MTHRDARAWHVSSSGHGELDLEALTQRILLDAAPELEHLRRRRAVLGALGAWGRSVVSVSWLLTALAGLAFLRLDRDAEPPASVAGVALAEAIMPETFAAWLSHGVEPDPLELARALEGLER